MQPETKPRTKQQFCCGPDLAHTRHVHPALIPRGMMALVALSRWSYHGHMSAMTALNKPELAKITVHSIAQTWQTRANHPGAIFLCSMWVR